MTQATDLSAVSVFYLCLRASCFCRHSYLSVDINHTSPYRSYKGSYWPQID